MKELELIAIEVRKKLLQTIVKAGGGHTGGSMSSVDILVALYFDVMNIDPGNPQLPPVKSLGGWKDPNCMLVWGCVDHQLRPR